MEYTLFKIKTLPFLDLALALLCICTKDIWQMTSFPVSGQYAIRIEDLYEASVLDSNHSRLKIENLGRFNFIFDNWSVELSKMCRIGKTRNTRFGSKGLGSYQSNTNSLCCCNKPPFLSVTFIFFIIKIRQLNSMVFNSFLTLTYPCMDTIPNTTHTATTWSLYSLYPYENIYLDMCI